jgi:hypothetical protein
LKGFLLGLELLVALPRAALTFKFLPQLSDEHLFIACKSGRKQSG